jgi:hypothetical protein
MTDFAVNVTEAMSTTSVVGNSSGKVIQRNVLMGDAPSTFAAS